MAHEVIRNFSHGAGLIRVNIDALAAGATYDVELPEEAKGAVTQLMTSAGVLGPITNVEVKFTAGSGLGTPPKITLTNGTAGALTCSLMIAVVS